jgi:hypothetical protein
MSETVKTYPLFAELMTATIPQTVFIPTVNDDNVEYINVWDNDDAEPLYVTSGCIFTIDSEGMLFYAPRYSSDGHFDVEEMDVVDFVDEYDKEYIEEIRNTLIAEYKRLGWYFQR